MARNNMSIRLQEILLDGEEVRWTGRPKPFALLGADSKREILLTWFFSAIILFAALVLLFFSLASGAYPLGQALILLSVVLFLPLVLSVRPLTDKKCLEQETFYAITNLRIISIVRDEALFIPLKKGVKMAVEKTSHEIGNLCFGSTIGQPQKKRRSLAVSGRRDSDSRSTMDGILFYNVEYPETLMAHFV